MRAMVLGFALVFSLTTYADEFHELVRYTCDVKQDRLFVTYVGAYNEEGEMLDKSAGKDDWPRPPSKTTGFGDASPLARRCELSDGQYTYKVEGVPETQTNFSGRCGAWSSAKVKITKDEKIIVEQQLDDTCWNPEALVVTKIEVIAGNSTPLITRIKPDDFFDPKSDFEDADQELNRIYKQLMSSLPDFKKSVLRKEQREWLKNRDPKCRNEADINDAGIGSMWATFYNSCRAITTRERTDALKEWR